MRANTNTPVASGSSVNVTDVKLRWDTINSPSRYRITATHPDGSQTNFQPSTSAAWNPASMDWSLSDTVRNGLFGAEAGDKGDGIYRYTVAVQNNGVWSLESDPVTLVYDTKAPVITDLSIDRNVTNGTQIRVLGTIKDDSLKNYNIRVYNADKSSQVTPWIGYTGTSSVENGTLATLNIDALQDGNYWVRVWADDTLGNRTGISPHIYVPFTIDRVVPEVSIVSNNRNDDGTYTIRGTTNDNTASVVVSVNGSTLSGVSPVDGAWEVKTGALEPGTYEIIARAIDGANNVGVSSPVSFTVSAPPTTDPETTPTPTPTPEIPVLPLIPTPPVTLGDEEEEPTTPITPASLAFVASAPQIAAAVADNNEEVLGVQTDNNDRRSIFGNDSSDILGVTASPKNADGSWNLLGLAWYWWLAVAAAVIGLGWWLLAAIRRRQEEAADV